MQCPLCNKDIGNPFNHEHKIFQSGSGFNATIGMVEYWFEIEVICPECGRKFQYADSSL